MSLGEKKQSHVTCEYVADKSKSNLFKAVETFLRYQQSCITTTSKFGLTALRHHTNWGKSTYKY